MKNSKQVETILKVLEIKKHAQLQELTRIMHLIEQRHANCKKC